MRGLISLINDNHVDNNLKEILVYVYFGAIVINRPKKQTNQHICTILLPVCVCKNTARWMANSADLDQTPRSATSDLGLQC